MLGVPTCPTWRLSDQITISLKSSTSPRFSFPSLVLSKCGATVALRISESGDVFPLAGASVTSPNLAWLLFLDNFADVLNSLPLRIIIQEHLALMAREGLFKSSELQPPAAVGNEQHGPILCESWNGSGMQVLRMWFSPRVNNISRERHTCISSNFVSYIFITSIAIFGGATSKKSFNHISNRPYIGKREQLLRRAQLIARLIELLLIIKWRIPQVLQWGSTDRGLTLSTVMNWHK